jgi:hypothetical protein
MNLINFNLYHLIRGFLKIHSILLLIIGLNYYILINPYLIRDAQKAFRLVILDLFKDLLKYYFQIPLEFFYQKLNFPFEKIQSHLLLL